MTPSASAAPQRLLNLDVATRERVFPDGSAREVADAVWGYLVGYVLQSSTSSAQTQAQRLGLWLDWCERRQVPPLYPSIAQVGAFRDALRERYRARSVKSTLAHGRTWLEYAEDNGMRQVPRDAANPFQRATRWVKVPVDRDEREGRFTDREVLRLYECAEGDQSQLAILLMGTCGLRSSELGWLDVEDVDFEDGGVARLNVAMKAGNRSSRWLPPWVTQHLRPVWERSRQREPEEETGRVPLLWGKDRQGRPKRWERHNTRAVVNRARQAAGIAQRRDVRAHRFRQFYRTRARDLRVDHVSVEISMGHSGTVPKSYLVPPLTREEEPAFSVAGFLGSVWAEEGGHIAPELVQAVHCTCQASTLIVSCELLGEDAIARVVLREPGTGTQPGVQEKLGSPMCPICGAKWRVSWQLGELMEDDAVGTRKQRVLRRLFESGQFWNAWPPHGTRADTWGRIS